MSCVNCGNDDGHYKVCMDCLEKIPSDCDTEYLVTVVSVWSVFAHNEKEAIDTFTDGHQLDTWNFAQKRNDGAK